MKAIGYIRVSTEDQAENGQSLGAQESKLRAYAELYELELIEIVVDAGKSAKNLDREGIQGALARLAAGEAKALVAVKLDRLTRSVSDLNALMTTSAKQGWSLMSVSEQIDTGSAAGRMIVNMMGVIAQWEREAIGERTSAALQHKAAKGEFTGGNAPYGLRVGSDGVNLEPDPYEQDIIAEALRLRDEGLSLRKVGKALSLAGMYPRKGKNWSASSIKNMIEANQREERKAA